MSEEQLINLENKTSDKTENKTMNALNKTESGLKTGIAIAGGLVALIGVLKKVIGNDNNS